MIPREAHASAAATVANLGPGYDVLGLCLSEPRDRVRAELTAEGRVEIVAITGDDGRLPTDPTKNCAGVAARWVLDRYAERATGVRLWLDKGLPPGSGMGSSAASSVAAAVAVAALVAPDATREELLEGCREGERVATGSPHPDNVAPCLLGGIVACLPRGGEDVEVIALPVPAGLYVAAVKPAFEVHTADARRILPEAVPLTDAVRNMANMVGLVSGLAHRDLGLVGRSLGDRLATPYRKALIPGFDEAVAAAVAAGAMGGGISGSGPTLFALTDGEEAARAAAEAMLGVFGEDAQSFVGAVDIDGARLY